MEIIKETFFPIVLKGAMRATQNMFWLTKITEEQAIALDNKWQMRTTSIGDVWVTYKRDKFGVTKEYARKTKPNYARQRKYLIAQYDASKQLKEYINSIDFVMPEDDFMIVGLFHMPKSWTKKKKKSMEYQLHKQKPDSDNTVKFALDNMFAIDSRASRFRNDACVSSFMCIKIYVPDNVAAGFKIVQLKEKSMLNLALKSIGIYFNS